MTTISPEVEALIRREMERRTYTDENDLLRQALEALAEQADVEATVQEALADVEAGRAGPWREFIDDLRVRKDLPRAS